MNKVEQDIEKGKTILRGKGCNLTAFKKELAELLDGTGKLDEDSWVDFYNSYSWCCGCMGYETIKDWATEFFQDFNKKHHRVWLK